MSKNQQSRGPTDIEATKTEVESVKANRAVANQKSEIHTSDKTSGVRFRAQSTGLKNRIQRTVKKSHEQIQRKEQNGGRQVSPNLESGVQSSRGKGSRLDTETRQQMSSKFGTDFSGVKIHNNSRAHHLAESINAKAFTVGEDIYFNKGEYNPGSYQGKKLLAHELTHTIQQKEGKTNDIQPSLYRMQKIYSGTKKIGPGITMRWKGKKVTINANLEIYGPNGSATNATAIESDIRSHWNKKFADGYEIKTNISVQARATGASAAANKTLIWVGPMTGPSNVKRGWVVGARYMSLDKNDLVWVPAHEFGHLLGLADRYSESIFSKIKGKLGYKRVNTVQPGWAGNIMAVHGGTLESKNVKNLLDKYAYRVVTIVEDGLDSVSREIGRYERALKRGWIPRF